MGYHKDAPCGYDQPEWEEVHCPVCGQALCFRDDVFTLALGDLVAGCSLCLHRHNAIEWLTEQRDDDWRWFAME